MYLKTLTSQEKWRHGLSALLDKFAPFPNLEVMMIMSTPSAKPSESYVTLDGSNSTHFQLGTMTTPTIESNDLIRMPNRANNESFVHK
jgi:hypothetical protein